MQSDKINTPCKSANDIRRQGKRLMLSIRDGHRQMNPEERKRHAKIAEIGRYYLRNFASFYNLPYGLKTWDKIGNEKLPRKIYAK